MISKQREAIGSEQQSDTQEALDLVVLLVPVDALGGLGGWCGCPKVHSSRGWTSNTQHQLLHRVFEYPTGFDMHDFISPGPTADNLFP